MTGEEFATKLSLLNDRYFMMLNALLLEAEKDEGMERGYGLTFKGEYGWMEVIGRMICAPAFIADRVRGIDYFDSESLERKVRQTIDKL